MDALSSGFVAMFNGALDFLGLLGSPLVLGAVVMLVSALWLAGLEVGELDRQGTKPEVGVH